MNIFDTLIVQPIFNLLVLIYSAVPGADFGIALILLTIVIRFLLWPLVKKQMHQVKAMRKLQPELVKMRKQHKGNRQAQGLAMMELYKKNGVSPFRSLGLLLIQLPIFIALYRIIMIFTNDRENIQQYTYGFLENTPLMQQLINDPASFNESFLGIVDLTQRAVGENGISIVLVILALVAAVTQYFMSKQTMPQSDNNKRLRDVLAEAGEGKQPDQSEMNAVVMRKMMKFLPVMMFVIMVSLPGALALYYGTSNMIAVIQQYFILRRDKHEMEDIAKEGEKQNQTKKREKNAKEAKVVKSDQKPANKKSAKIDPKANITRIKAKE